MTGIMFVLIVLILLHHKLKEIFIKVFYILLVVYNLYSVHFNLGVELNHYKNESCSFALLAWAVFMGYFYNIGF